LESDGFSRRCELPSPLPRPVKLLGWVSLLTDAATEAVYPLLPVFITQVLGGPPVALGVVEGAADATSSILKVVAGRWSDRDELGARLRDSRHRPGGEGLAQRAA
jgi:hypothetical protein